MVSEVNLEEKFRLDKSPGGGERVDRSDWVSSGQVSLLRGEL
jgi:hypothetical protein